VNLSTGRPSCFSTDLRTRSQAPEKPLGACSGRPRLPLQELRRRSEAVSIVEEEVRTGTKKQSEAIRDAIAEMRKRGKGEGLSVRKLERALQRKRSAGDPPKPKI
jgi:hypothetical protein